MDEDRSKRLRRGILIAFTAAAVAFPLLLARRIRNQQLSNPAPPLRNISSTHAASRIVSAPSTSSVSPSAPLKPSIPPHIIVPTVFRAAAAFGIATALVGLGASAAVYGVRNAWNVHSIEQFSHRMRHELSTRFPSVSNTIHEALASDAESSSFDVEIDEIDGWDYDASKARLIKAYEEGGATRLGDVMWSEMQRESRYLLRKRERDRQLPPPSSVNA